jgi:hypothetical protein
VVDEKSRNQKIYLENKGGQYQKYVGKNQIEQESPRIKVAKTDNRYVEQKKEIEPVACCCQKRDACFYGHANTGYQPGRNARVKTCFPAVVQKQAD